MLLQARDRWRAGAAARGRGQALRRAGGRSASLQSSFERTKVSGAWGSGTSPPAKRVKPANSLRRPSVTALAQLGVVVREEEEGRARVPLLPHEEQRRVGRAAAAACSWRGRPPGTRPRPAARRARGCPPDRGSGCRARSAPRLRATRGRAPRRGRVHLRRLPLVEPALAQRAREVLRRAGVVLVVALACPRRRRGASGGGSRPPRRRPARSRPAAGGRTRRVSLRSSSAMTTTRRPGSRGPGALRDGRQQVRRAVVHDGVRGVQAQPVRVVVADPHLHVGQHQLAHHRAEPSPS